MILEIDTTEKMIKLALHQKDFSLISEKEFNLQGELSERLLIEVDKMLDESGLKKNDLESILVNRGPGSYTGLRIGVTAGNFLGYALNIPIVDELARLNRNNHPGLVKFESPVLPYYKEPPHITKSVLPS